MSRRRVAGLALVATGAALLLHVGASAAGAALARDRARGEWERADARRAVSAARAFAGGGRGDVALAPGAPVARLVIPALGLDEIVVEGVTEASLRAGPGHVPGSAMPGAPGNAVLSAHRDRHFHRLDRVSIGDTVVTETAGERVVWRVAGRRVVAAGAPALRMTSEPVLTLTTCWPVRWLGPAPDRLLLTAVPVSRSPRA